MAKPAFMITTGLGCGEDICSAWGLGHALLSQHIVGTQNKMIWKSWQSQKKRVMYVGSKRVLEIETRRCVNDYTTDSR